MIERQGVVGISREEAREYILDILQELAQMARVSGDDVSEEAVTVCWQTIWKMECS